MFSFAVLTGIYSYIIFLLGIAGLLYKNIIIGFTGAYLLILLYIYRKKIIGEIRNLKEPKKLLKNRLILLLSFIFVLQAVINMIGALGPELAFDALWYHLTLPKLYLEHHSIFFIPGGLLYYSAMPKLGEMLYIVGLAFGNEISAKIIHYSFGLLSCLVIYKFSRKLFSPLISLIGMIIFYSNLVVAWESITAYIDLIRAFFEIMALWALINWREGRKTKWLALSAIMVGLAITVKLLAFVSLIIFINLLFYMFLDSRLRGNDKEKNNLRNLFIDLFTYFITALAVPLPWLIFSYENTGNPVYPFFSEIYKVAPEPLSAIGFLREIWNLFTNSPDPLTPLYMIFLPLIILNFSKFRTEIKIITIYSVLSIIVWFLTPRTGGGRFILPYLPALSIVCTSTLDNIIKNKKNYHAFLPKFLIILIIFVALITIGYRLAANSKYIPVLIGKQSKQEFLTNNLNFSFGDFYDTDNYFKNNIKQTDNVLLFGFHNLYYANFPFIDSSWLKERDKFNYIAVKNSSIPEKYNKWKLIYSNPKTMVKLYKNPQ